MPTSSPYDELVAAIDLACVDKNPNLVQDLAIALGMKPVAKERSTEYWRYVLHTQTDGTITLSHRWHDPSGPFQNEPDEEILEVIRSSPCSNHKNCY